MFNYLDESRVGEVTVDKEGFYILATIAVLGGVYLQNNTCHCSHCTKALKDLTSLIKDTYNISELTELICSIPNTLDSDLLCSIPSYAYLELIQTQIYKKIYKTFSNSNSNNSNNVNSSNN